MTVTGDVYFGRNVTLRGTVIVVANEGQRIDIPDGCVLENRLLSGNLNMIVRVSSFHVTFAIADPTTSTSAGSIIALRTFVSFNQDLARDRH